MIVRQPWLSPKAEQVGNFQALGKAVALTRGARQKVSHVGIPQAQVFCSHEVLASAQVSFP